MAGAAENNRSRNLNLAGLPIRKRGDELTATAHFYRWLLHLGSLEFSTTELTRFGGSNASPLGASTLAGKRRYAPDLPITRRL